MGTVGLGSRAHAIGIGVAVVVLAAGAGGAGGATASTQRASVSSAGVQGDAASYEAALSANGRDVAFASHASNLVVGDTNGALDIFVRDLRSGITVRASVSSSGAQANADSRHPVLSANGRFVAFTSTASNLVRHDTNGADDVFVRDLRSGVTRRVSVSSTGGQANAGSGFWGIAMSANGRFVTFSSDASNLVAHDTDGCADTFLRDRRRGTTRRVSVSSSGAQPNSATFASAVSADGRYVAFDSYASNLVRHDMNGAADVFVRDRRAHTTRRVSVSSTGAQGTENSFNPSLSANGRFVAFQSYSGLAPGGPGEFVRDRRTGTTRLVSVSSAGVPANASPYLPPAISANGRFVAFWSDASNLVPGDLNGLTDVFVRDRWTGTTGMVVAAARGVSGDAAFSTGPAISGDGRFVAFWSDSSALVPGDTNGVVDVFVHGPIS